MAKTYGCVERTSCRICGYPELSEYVNLGEHPPSNGFIAVGGETQEQRFPLRVMLCSHCGHSQLSHIVSAHDIFDDYVYLSSTSRALVRQYQELVDWLTQEFQPSDGSLVVDVGANDGVMLDRYPAGCFKLLGVEPSSAGDIAARKGHDVVRSFFHAQTAREIVSRHGRATLVTMTNVFAHIDDIHSIADGLSNLLAEDGVLVIEFPYLIDMIDHLYFDTIYHEHLSYLSVSPLKTLFNQVGMRPFMVRRVSIGASGPAVRLLLCHDRARYPTESTVEQILKLETDWGLTKIERYSRFADRVEERLHDLRELIGQLKSNGASIAAFSAPAKGNTLLNAARFGPETITVVSENNEGKIGKLTPGSHIPIVSDDEFLKSKYDYALLLAWNYADFFVKNSTYVKQGGRFVIPLPNLKISP